MLVPTDCSEVPINPIECPYCDFLLETRSMFVIGRVDRFWFYQCTKCKTVEIYEERYDLSEDDYCQV